MGFGGPPKLSLFLQEPKKDINLKKLKLPTLITPLCALYIFLSSSLGDHVNMNGVLYHHDVCIDVHIAGKISHHCDNFAILTFTSLGLDYMYRYMFLEGKFRKMYCRGS